MTHEHADIAIIGAGAAGLMASIAAGRAARGRLRIVAIDGARTLGAKILVAGGGRCNVTHYAVDESAYAGSSRHAIKQVLRAFGVDQTVAFFREIGVDLKREETGKLFPTTDNARTVLNALLKATREAGVEIRHPWRVASVSREDQGFQIEESAAYGASRALHASRVILATGGLALPKSGSDGHGYTIARALGHTITPTFAALVPLVLADGHFLRALSGIAFNASLELRAGTGKRLVSFTNSVLCTHFGLSGPGVLDISRYYLDPRQAGNGRGDSDRPRLTINFIPDQSADAIDKALSTLGRRPVIALLREWSPERLAQALCEEAGVDPSTTGAVLTREQRRGLVSVLTELPLPVAGDRGFTYAEATAGGVPLSEIHLQTMESRITPGLHLCGEICDVDGRIGGFNFQWAWSSGHVAGKAAARQRDATSA